MKRALLAVALMLFPAVALAQDEHPLTVPKVPRMSLVPTVYEMELLRQPTGYQALIEVMSDLPNYRVPLGGDYERELMWTTSPFASSIPALVPFRF